MATRQQIRKRNTRRTEAVMHGAGNTKLLSYDDAAEALGVSRNTVKALIAAGKLPFVDLGRKTKRIREADLEALINAKTHYAPAKSA